MYNSFMLYLSACASDFKGVSNDDYERRSKTG